MVRVLGAVLGRFGVTVHGFLGAHDVTGLSVFSDLLGPQVCLQAFNSPLAALPVVC